MSRTVLHNWYMHKNFFSFLKKYSNNTVLIDRLIVSLFIYLNRISVVNNNHINSYIIHNNDDDFNTFTTALKHLDEFSIEDLVKVFEFVISPEDKIVTGAVYTPHFIRSYILDKCLENQHNIQDLTICDPACGCSGFLLTAAEKIKSKTNLTYKQIFQYNIFGVDIQPYSIERSKILLTLFAILNGEDNETFHFNLFTGNTLGFDWEANITNYSKFDLIVGNPPYICSRNLDNESRHLLKNWSVCNSGHPDLYIPFFQIGLTILKQNGKLGYLTMNTFFKSLNGRSLREYFSSNKFNIKIIDFGNMQVFSNKSTYTCICLIDKTNDGAINYLRADNLIDLTNLEFDNNKIRYEELNNKNGWNLSQISILNIIESTGTPLGEKFRSRNGIATLKNNVYIFTPKYEDLYYYYLDSNKSQAIEKAICKDIVNPNKLTNKRSLETVKEKLIFPYIFTQNGQAQVISEEKLAKDYPNTYNYLQAHKSVLALRDKGNGSYPEWYAYGRTQSLEQFNHKILFPHIASSTPDFVIDNDENLFFYNGMAILSNDVKELILLKKIMSSRLFWFYITHSSKPYGSNYYSLSRNYIRNFGLYSFSEEEIKDIINENDPKRIDQLIEHCYNIVL